MSERKGYRDNLEIVSATFPGKMIPVLDAARFLSIDKRVLMRDATFPRKLIGSRWYVSIAELANYMCCR